MISTSRSRQRPGSRSALATTLGVTLVSASLTAAALGVTSSPAGAASTDHPVTGRVSLGSDGTQGTGWNASNPDISTNGRWVAYISKAAGLVAGLTPAHLNVFRTDRATGATILVTVAAPGTGVGANADVLHPQISDDGRFVSFETIANNMAAGDANGVDDVYRRDIVLGTTRLISRFPGGAIGNAASGNPTMSSDGSRVAFQSLASNLVAPDVAGQWDAFVWSSPDQITRISSGTGGAEANGSTIYPAISGDGTTVAFQSSAQNLTATGTNNNVFDIFARAVSGGSISRVSVPKTGAGATNGGSYTPQISYDGNKVAFNSPATNLVDSDTNGHSDAFLRDRSNGTTTRTSTDAFGGQLAHGGGIEAISSNGEVTAFGSTDQDVLSPSSTGFKDHLYVRTAAGILTAVDVRDATGGYGNGPSFTASLSGTGRYVAFDSDATDLVRNDTNGFGDVFVRDGLATSEPFDNWTGLVAQQYLDFTGKAATPAVLTEQVARLANGETSVGRFLVDMAHDPAWSAKRGPVIRLYWAFFLRAPDKTGLAYWLGKSQNGMTLPAMASKFAVSPEFKNTYGPLSNTDFVHLVYGNVLQRKADAAGVTHWVNKLQTGLSRGGMMVQFSESSEGKRVMAPYVDVLLLHLGLLRKLPTAPEFTTETSGVSPITEIADQLRLRPDYAARTAN